LELTRFFSSYSPLYFILAGNNLVGELPNELGLLIGLEHLSLFYNELAGNLPENLQYLSLVNFVAMESNLFTGPIPDWISEWTNLEYLALGDNQFSGELPSFAALDNLLELALDSNYLTGSVDVFNDALALEVLFLQNNGFDNEMDGDLFYYLENLRILDMHSNNLGGYLSPHFYNVEILDLHNNSISDAMPEITVDDSPLTFLSLFNNDFSGAIPDSISKLAGLTHLDLSLNGFTGAIPGSAINMLTDLVYLFLGDNPFAFGDFPNIWDLGLIQEISLKVRKTTPIPKVLIGHRIEHRVSQLPLLTLLFCPCFLYHYYCNSRTRDVGVVSLTGLVPHTFLNSSCWTCIRMVSIAHSLLSLVLSPILPFCC
jgi:hypothetical protein